MFKIRLVPYKDSWRRGIWKFLEDKILTNFYADFSIDVCRVKNFIKTFLMALIMISLNVNSHH